MLIRWRNDVISTERDICAGGRWVLIARRAALVVGLVDKPNARKQHLGHIPLVGGIAVYLTLMLMTLWQPAWLPDSAVYLLCVTALVVLGVLDDRFDLPVAPRVMVQGGSRWR